ncbi:MAG: NYN domain-containing protein, partial [Clostridiales Family XIII bacterium]|nr:NYN domain-containing protein [Clostridiales Family XIII bacterium]
SYTNGKNSSDSVLIINAMDILYGGNAEIICIVSSDSDFTRLAMRIVEAGLEVIGMGEEKTAESFINACTTFKFLGGNGKHAEHKNGKSAAGGATDTWQTDRDREKTASTREDADQEGTDRKYLQAPKKVIVAISNAIKNLDEDNDGWIKISLIGDMLHNRFPDFDPTIWGARSKQLSTFLMQLADFEVKGISGSKPNSPTNYFIRIRK